MSSNQTSMLNSPIPDATALHLESISGPSNGANGFFLHPARIGEYQRIGWLRA